VRRSGIKEFHQRGCVRLGLFLAHQLAAIERDLAHVLGPSAPHRQRRAPRRIQLAVATQHKRGTAEAPAELSLAAAYATGSLAICRELHDEINTAAMCANGGNRARAQNRAEHAADAVQREDDAGAFDRDAVRCVLEAAGTPTARARSPTAPARISSRNTEQPTPKVLPVTSETTRHPWK
jgi:hypothetical protein